MRSFEKGKVTILTPCYNGERFLDRYFDAICKQTYDRIELIVVNDGKSSDSSEQICLSWKERIERRGYEFRYIIQKTYRGAAGAINEGLPFVTGEFLTWPDCDDTLMPTSIEKKVAFLNQHPDYAMVRSDFISVLEDKPEIVVGKGSDWADIKKEDIFDNLMFEKTYVTPGCYLVRSTVLFERIPSGIIYWENEGGQNWQLLLPCSYKNKTGYIDEPLYKYFIRSDSHSHRIEGEEYQALIKRTEKYSEILFHVINDFSLLSDDERTEYRKKITLRYILMRLDLALSYNHSDDAKAEMNALKQINYNPGIRRQLWFFLSYFGLSMATQKSYSLCMQIYRKILSLIRRKAPS